MSDNLKCGVRHALAIVGVAVIVGVAFVFGGVFALNSQRNEAVKAGHATYDAVGNFSWKKIDGAAGSCGVSYCSIESVTALGRAVVTR